MALADFSLIPPGVDNSITPAITNIINNRIAVAMLMLNDAIPNPECFWSIIDPFSPPVQSSSVVQVSTCLHYRFTGHVIVEAGQDCPTWLREGIEKDLHVRKTVPLKNNPSQFSILNSPF
jgi:hypothetical protein